MAMDEKGLGLTLQHARQKAGLTQQAMCQQAGLSYSTLAKIERGAIKAPSIFTIMSIAKVLNLSLDQLIGTSHPTKPKEARTKSGVSFIYFDVNGCLVHFFHRAFTKIAQDFDLSPDVVETVFWQYNDAVNQGKFSLESFNKIFAKELGIPAIAWQEYYLQAVSPISEMHELIEWAAKKYKIGLLTNIASGIIELLIKEKLIPDVTYTAIVDSSKVGVIKPDPKIYEIAESMAGVPASEILLVDDTRANLSPAQKAGWHVMWFDDYDSQESTYQVRKALEPAT
jgi:FMN phosphatase YigB (HAD superfamily)